MVATVLIVAALVLFGYSRFEFGRAVGTSSEASFHFGDVDVFTDDPAAAVTVRLRFSADYLDYITDDPLSIGVAIDSQRDVVRFAVLLGGDAARTGIQPRSMSVLPRGDRRQAGDMWVQGDVIDAWYVDSAGPAPANSEPPPVGALVVGRARRPESGVPLAVSLVTPTNGTFVQSTATGFEFYLPEVGSQPGRHIDTEMAFRADGERVIPAAARLIDETDWQQPAALTAEVRLFDVRENDRVDSTPPPTETDRSERLWRDAGPLEVTGIVERVAEVRRSEQRQFLAGAAVGLSGALLVWGLEIVLEVGLDARRSRGERRRSHS